MLSISLLIHFLNDELDHIQYDHRSQRLQHEFSVHFQRRHATRRNDFSTPSVISVPTTIPYDPSTITVVTSVIIPSDTDLRPLPEQIGSDSFFEPLIQYFQSIKSVILNHCATKFLKKY
ncbi:hypothetical protein TNCV_1308811 [Trichonephila clavipes]|nr:hypothetical protein TNCV_1308811 [Trichonephila clavipes]